MDVRFHLPVLSECDADCKLCSSLGCLRPARLTYPEFLNEIDRALLSCATIVVFPPNFLSHPEASQFCAEVSRRGLKSLVRLRPAQLASYSELLSELEFRGATFEVLVSGLVPAIKSRIAFKTVLIPSRECDPTLLYESLPFSWRRDLEVLAFPALLSADELFLFLSSRSLKPYSDTSRFAAGQIPGARETVEAFGQRIDQVRVSVLINEPTVAQLEALNDQSLDREMFEVVAVGSSDDVVSWCSSHTLAVTLIQLPLKWGAPRSRMSESFALAALYARGTRLIFLGSEFPIEKDFLLRGLDWAQNTVSIESRSSDRPVRRALMMTTKSYFQSGGFRLANDGFEFDFALWKTPGALWVLGDLDKEGVPALVPKVTLERALSAQDFYFATLDSKVYRSSYTLMGAKPAWRRTYRTIASLGAIQMISNAVVSLSHRIRSSRLQAAMAKTARVSLNGGRA